jgi:DNA repair exonuclease SbcCD ATPase subunit
MHIQFKSIAIKGFRSFINETIIQFDDCGAGLYFLKGKNLANPALGSNGSGKSSCVDALMWCLYGKTVQGLKNPDIMPWIGKQKPEVSVTLQIDDETHVIKRTASPNRISLNDKESGQEYINTLIPIPFEIIPYTIILGQRQPLFFDLTAGEKLKLFSEVLNLDRWEIRSSKAAEIVAKLEKEISSSETEIVSLDKEQIRNKTNLADLKEASKNWELDQSEKEANREAAKKTLQSQLEALIPDRDDADLKLETACIELKAVEPSLEKLLKEERPLVQQLVELRTTISHAQADKKVLEKQKASISDKVCPTCERSLTDPKVSKKLLADLETKLKVLDAVIISSDSEVADLERVQFDILAKIEIQKQAKSRFRQSEMDCRDTLGRILPRIARFEEQIKALDQVAKESLEEDNPYTDQIRSLRARINDVNNELQILENDIKTKSEQCERARFWIKGFKDIKLYTIEEILQELQITTNSMVEEFGLVGWNITYDIEKENKSGTISKGLNITVTSPANKEAVKWESWSGGEAQRLRIVGTEAFGSTILNHAGVTTNLAIYDEPTESLSKEGVNDLVELLAQRAKDTNKSIWLIDHHALLSDRFVAEISIVKDKSGSHLEV